MLRYTGPITRQLYYLIRIRVDESFIKDSLKKRELYLLDSICSLLNCDKMLVY